MPRIPQPPKAGGAPPPLAVSPVNGRPIKFPARPPEPLTPARAKELLGWEEETDDVKFGQDYLLVDRRGRKVRCANNPTNRPFYAANCDRLVQDILNHRWRWNGEPVIIGETGLVLNGQHTLAAVVLAEQTRTGPRADDWADRWPGEVTIHKTVTYGVPEDDDTVNTMDTAKPRSFADVLYRSPYFGSLKGADRKRAAVMCDWAIRTMWERTHSGVSAYAPTRTFAEGLSFLDRHPRLLEAVAHVLREDVTKDDGKRPLDKLRCPAGQASAYLYLMAASATRPDGYRADRREESLDLTRWDAARDFWTLLIAGSPRLAPVVQALAMIYDHRTGTGTGTTHEVVGVVIKAWNLWVRDRPVTLDTLRCNQGECPSSALRYYRHKDGDLRLDEWPTVGGVDFGRQEEVDHEGADGPDEGEDLEAAKEEARAKTREQEAARAAARRKARAAGKGARGYDSSPGGRLAELVARLKAAHDARVLFFKAAAPDGREVYQLWGADAVALARASGKTAMMDARPPDAGGTGQYLMQVPADQLAPSVERLLRVRGQASAVVEPDGEDYRVTHQEVRSASRAAPPRPGGPRPGAAKEPA